MEGLLEKAAKFLEENALLNEIELSDCLGNKVRVIRNTPAITVRSFPPAVMPHYYRWQYFYHPDSWLCPISWGSPEHQKLT